MSQTKRGIIKTKEELDIITSCFNGDGWHLKGQFFPLESYDLFGTEHEFTKEWQMCWSCLVNGEYRFISEEAISFLK